MVKEYNNEQETPSQGSKNPFYIHIEGEFMA
jgi:hypothetical protein